jgi:hypothetical protein
VISDKKKFLFVSLCVELVLWMVRHESDKIFTFSYHGGGGGGGCYAKNAYTVQLARQGGVDTEDGTEESVCRP